MYLRNLRNSGGLTHIITGFYYEKVKIKPNYFIIENLTVFKSIGNYKASFFVAKKRYDPRQELNLQIGHFAYA